MREHTEERLNREWGELYERMRSILQKYGEDDIDGGDYYLVDENFGRYEHQVEMHQLHMLRPEIIQSLQALLVDYPDWEIEISVSVPEEDISIDPGEGLTLRDDGIIDALDRALLPEEYQGLRYEGARPRKMPDIKIHGDD
jgi:hypothetical protein